MEEGNSLIGLITGRLGAKPMKNKLAIIIAEKLQQMGATKLILNPSIQRLRPGRHGRSAGAWSWCLCEDGRMLSIGSEDSASIIAKGFAIRKHLGDIHLDRLENS